jgi:hypothetical protein
MDQTEMIAALIVAFVLLLPAIVRVLHRARLGPHYPVLKYSEETDKKTGKHWHVYLISSRLKGLEFLYVVPIGNNRVVNQNCIAESINVQEGTAVAVMCPEPLSSIYAITNYAWFYFGDLSYLSPMGGTREGSLVILDRVKELWFHYQIQLSRPVSVKEIREVIGHINNRPRVACEIAPVLGYIDQVSKDIVTSKTSETQYIWVRCPKPITTVSIKTSNGTIIGIPIAFSHPGIPVQKRIVTNYPPRTTPNA